MLGHLSLLHLFPLFGVNQILFLVEMRSDFNQPFWLNANNISHELFCCENQFMINHPFWLVFKNH